MEGSSQLREGTSRRICDPNATYELLCNTPLSKKLISLVMVTCRNSQNDGQYRVEDEDRCSMSQLKMREERTNAMARSWYTAFYCFAEHMRVFTDGRVNHKVLYSHVGTKGYYINHENPSIRKSCAASLSRMMHSQKYIEDFQLSFKKNPAVFDDAALAVGEEFAQATGLEDAELIAALSEIMWPDIAWGLANEFGSWRTDLSLKRVEREVESLLGMVKYTESFQSRAGVKLILSSFFHVMTFGCLEERLMYRLSDETPLMVLSKTTPPRVSAHQACLIKQSGSNILEGLWKITPDQPFVIGRYTDCDVIETNQYVSRMHCRINCRSGTWLFEDLGSRHGSKIIRKDEAVFDSTVAHAGVLFELEHGDRIALAADTSQFWFSVVGDEHPIR